MKIQAFAVSFLSAVIALLIPISAASYIDNMDNINDDNVKRYSGLTARSFSNAAAAVVPDATSMTFSGNRLISHADYRVSGATSVTASIYSQCGTFVSPDPNNPSQYMLGVFKDNMDFLPNTLTQALYCKLSTGVYTREGGLKQAYTDFNAFYFGNITSPPQGELLGYGVNIYFSIDGVGFVNAQAVHSGLNYSVEHVYCLEYYTAKIPASATHIRVEINDFSIAPLAWGGFHEKGKHIQTSLASVLITGDNLVVGEPEPEIEFPVPSFSSSSSTGYYSANSESSSKAKASSSSKAAESAEPKKKAASSSSTPSSKFTGTITSSSKSESSRSKRTEPSSSRSVTSKSDPETSVEDEIPRDETVVYEIKKSDGKTGFDKGIIAYIIAVSGVIFTLAVLPKRK